MFVVIYQGSEEPVGISQDQDGVSIVGKWQVDTEPEGKVATYEDIREALSRVEDIRKKGGEACLAVIVE